MVAPPPSESATLCGAAYAPAGPLAVGAAGATVSLVNDSVAPWNVPVPSLNAPDAVSAPSARPVTSLAGKVAVQSVPAIVAACVTALPAESTSLAVTAVTPGSALPETTRSLPTLAAFTGRWLASVGALGAYGCVHAPIGPGVAPASNFVCSPPAVAGAPAGPVQAPSTIAFSANTLSAVFDGMGQRAVQCVDVGES